MAQEGEPSYQPPPSQGSSQETGAKEGSAAFLRAARAGNLEKVLELLRSGTDINTCNANGLNALHLASKEGHHEVVRELLRRGANVDAATKKGNTSLHIASLAGQSVIVTILVEHGANVNVQSLNGFTPLYMSAQENHEDVVRYLLAHGANQALATEDGFTPLAVALQQGHDRIVAILLENDTRGKVRLPALHIAAKKDDTKAATLLLQNEHNPDVTSKSGFTPLHISAHYGHENVARLLIERGANVNYQARHNITPLHVAAKWGRLNMCQMLLENNADIKSQTKDLLTPLHCAARSGHDQVVDFLLNYKPPAPISAKTKNGLVPLHMAAQGDHVDCARILLYHRAPVDDITVDYLTPLHVAAHCGHVRVAKLLLDRNADPNSRALNGFTPLHIACKKNRIKVVELLLKYHAAIEATTESGLAPLHVASFMGCINIVIYLLQQGANVDAATVRGETSLHLAARANQTDVVRVLIRNGAKVDAAARELQTPLHIASRLGNTDIVVLLLQAGANPNSATRDQYTSLHIAAKEGQEEVAAILLDHGADKTLLTKKGFTALHLASKYANLPVVKLLLERGCPVDIEGKNQVTALHVASHYNNDKVAMLLLENGASAKATAKNGYQPLHISAKKNQMEIASILLQYQADPNAKSRAGFTPLHLSSQEGHREMSSMLIENGADVGAKANNGLTAMHLCAQEDRVPVAEVLHNHGADVNAKTKAGYTPLHVASHFGQLNMVRWLIEHGADVNEKTQAAYTSLHQAAQQGHNNCVRYLLENGASPNAQNAYGQTPLSIAQRLGYVSVVETLKTVTETTVITETTVPQEERYKPQNPEAMNETMFSESEDEGAVAEHEAATAAAHAKDFSDNLTKGLADSTAVHMIHTGEQLLSRSAELEGKRLSTAATDGPDNLEELIRRAQAQPVTSASAIHESYLDHSTKDDNIPIGQHVAQPSFLISFLVDARGGAMRGCRHSGVRIIVPPRKASQPIRVTCRYLRKDKLAHPPPLSEGEELASRILEMAPAGAKFLGPVILEVPHFASLREREREIVILRSDDGQHWKEHQLEATEDAVQEVLNESFDAEELAQLDDLHTPRITRILTSDFPMYFAVVTRIRQEVHCVGPEGGVIISSVVPRVQAIFPDGSLTKTIKVSVQAQPVPHEMVTRLHGNRVAVSPIVTVEPRRRKFHKPITLCIPIPQSSNKQMLTQYSGQAGQEPPTLRLLCSITGGSAPAQWEDITGTTQLTFTGDEVSFTTTVSARFWLMDCQTPRDAARMAQEVYNEAIAIPYMAKFVVFARRTFPVEGQLRVFCMTDDKEDKTLEKQEHFKMIAKSRDVEVLKGKHQFLEFAGNLVPVTKSGDQLSLFFLPFQENRLAFMVKTRNKDDAEAATEGRIAFMKEPKIRSETLPPQQPICTLAISLPEYTGDIVYQQQVISQKDTTPFGDKYRGVLEKDLPGWVHPNVLKSVGADWPRLARALELPHSDIQYLRHHYSTKELPHVLRIWMHLKKEEADPDNLNSALHRIGREDIVRSVNRGDEPDFAYTPTSAGVITNGTAAPGSLTDLKRDSPKLHPPAGVEFREKQQPSAVEIKEKHHVETREVHHPVVEEVIIPEPRQSLSKSRSKSPEPEPELIHEPTPPLREEEEIAPIPEQPEQEETVSEVRTVVRTERHVHDTEEGPIVEEKIITTTYEDDVAVNESVEVRTVALNEEEMNKWNELNQIVDQPGDDLKKVVDLPEGIEQEVKTERHVEDDGTVVTTVVTTSRYSDSPSSERADSAHEAAAAAFQKSKQAQRQGDCFRWPHGQRNPSTPCVLSPFYRVDFLDLQALTVVLILPLSSASLPPICFIHHSIPEAHSMSSPPESPPSPQVPQIIYGLTPEGQPISGGLVEPHPEPPLTPEISTSEVHHVELKNQFEAEPWEGEHAEPEPEEEKLRRFSLLSVASQLSQDQPHDETTPISSSVQFERTRSPSLAAALLEPTDPQAAAHVGFHPLLGAATILEADETYGNEQLVDAIQEFQETLPEPFDEERPDELDTTLARLITTIGSLQMSGQKDKYLEAVNRLKELEEELRVAGAVTPADPAIQDAVARALSTARPGRDIQIRVNQSKHTTTTKTVYETETPAMANLDPEKIKELHQQMMGSLTSKYEPSGEPPGGTTQKKETAEEGFTNEDGSVVVSKKMTRVVTTTRTTLPGDDSSSAPGDDDETRSRSEDEQSVKSVKDKIAMFEQQFAGDKPIKQYEYQKPDVYRDEDEEMMSSEPLMETSEVVREAMKVSGGSDEGQPQPGMATIADPTLSLGEAAISVASLAGSDIVRDDQERPESEPAKRTKYSTSHETTTTYSMSRKRLGEDGEELEDYEQTGSEIGEMPTPMTRSGHDVEEEPMIRAYASGVEPQTAPEAAPRRISATSTTSSTQIVHQEPQEGSDDDIEADTRIVTKEDGSLQGIEESKDEPEAEYQPMMRRTSSTEPTFTTYRHEQEPVEVREEIDVKMLPSGDTVITEKDTMIQHPIHESPRHSESHRSSDEEEEGPSRGEKALGFMKQAGKIAGAAVAAPVVLAGIGAAKAYDALTRDKSPESEQLEERRFEQESPVGGMKHEPTSETQFTETTTISPEPSETGQRERSSQSDAGDLESSDAGPRRTTLTETTTSYTLSRKHEGHPDEGNIEAETLDELHEHTEPEITESYTRKETFDEEGHPVIIETETHTERRRLSSMSEDKPSHETPQEQEFSRRVEHDLEGNTVITETSTTFIHHSPEEERRSLPESEKFEVSEQQRSGRSSPVVEEPEVEEITTVTKTTITQRPSITSSDLESAEVQRPIEEEPYPQESEFSRIEEIDPSGRTASITESITTRRTSDQEGSDSEHPAEEETIVTRKVEHEPTGDTIITETTTVSRTKRLSQSSEITDIVEPENVETIVQKPPEFTEEPEVEGEYKTEEIRTSTSIQRQPSGEMVVTETKTTTTVIHQPPQMEGDIEEAKEQSPEDDVHRQIGGATIKRSSEHENLSHIGLSGAEKETDIDADLHHHHPEPFSERTVSESHVEDIDKSEDMPRRMSEPDEHEKDLSVERESFDSSHIESPSKQHREGLREELSAPDFEAPQFKDEFRSDVSLPEPRRDSQISDESEGEEGPSRGEKALGFMKKAGKIAGAAIAAPAVLAGMGAMKAYEAIKGDGSPEEHREIHREFEQVQHPRETQHETKRESSHFEDVQHSPSERRGPSPSEFEVKESYEGRRPESPAGAQRRDSFYQEEQHFEPEGPIIHGDVSEEFKQILRKSPSQEEIHREKSPSPQSQRRDSFYQEEQHFEPEGPIIHGDVSEEFRQILKEGPSEEEIHREKSPSQSSIQQKESSPISSPTSTEHRRDSFYQEEQKYEPEGPITHSEISQEFKQVLREGPSEEELYSSQIHREKSPSISSTKQKESPISSPTSTEHRRDSFYQGEQHFEPEGPIIHGDVSEEFKQILRKSPSQEEIHREKSPGPQSQRRDSFYQEEQHFEPEGPIIHGDVSEEFKQILRKSPSQEEIHREKSPSPQSQRRDSFYQEEQHFEPEGPIIHGDVSEEFRQILKEGPSEEEIHREKSPSQSSIQQKESSPISSPTSTEHRRDSFYQEEQKYEPEGPITHSEVSQEFKQVLREGPSEEELYSSQIHREKSPSISSTKQKESPISSPTSTEHRRDSFYQEEQHFEPEGPIIHGDVSEEFKQILKEGPSEEDIHSESHLEREPLDKEGLPTPEEIKNIIETTAIIEEQTMHEPPHHEGSDLERSSTTEMTSSVSTIVRRSVGSEEAELQQSKDEEHVIDSQRYSEDNEMDRDQFPSIPRDESFKKRSDDESGSDGEDKPEGRGGGAQLIRHEPTSDRPIFETEQLSSEIQPGIVESESYDRELGTQQTHEHEPTSMQTPLSSPVKTTDRESPIELDYGQSYDRSLQEEPIQKEESRDSLGHIIQSESYDTMKEETERHSPHRSPTASERSLKSFDGEQISQFTPQQQIFESSDMQQRQVESVPYEIESEGYGLQHEERGLHSPVRAESPLAEHRRESFGDDVERQQQRVETRQIGEEPTGHIIDSEAYGTHEEEAERKLSGPKSPVLSESSEQGKLLTGRDSESDDEFEEQPKKKGGALEFMKKAGKIAGAAIAAPVVLAGVGAAKAYDALKKEDSPKGSSSYDYSRTPDHPEEFDQSDHEEEYSKGQPESRSHIVESESYEHTFKQDVSSSQDEAKPASYGISEPRRTSFTEETQQQHSPVDIQSGTQRESPIHSPKISPEKIQEDYIIESEDYDQTISQSQELDRPFSPAYTEAKDEVEIRKERDMEQHHKDLSPREGRYTEEYITESQPDHPAVASHIVESESYSSHLRQHDEPDQLPERPDHPISEMAHSSQLSEITAESFSPQHEPTSAHFIESTEYHTQPIETSEVSHISDEKMQSHLDDSQPISKESGWETSYEDKPDIHDYELDYSQGGQPLEERTSSQDEGVGSRPESERSLQHKEEAADLPLESQRSTLETTSSHIEHEQQEFDRQKSPAETPEDQKRYLPTGESYDEIGSDTEEGESSGQKALGFLKKAGKIAGGVIAAPAVLAGVGAVKAYEAIKGDKDEGGQITPTSSPQEQAAYSPSKQSPSRSSLRDDDSTIAGEQSHRPEDIKHVEEIQSFSETLTTDLLQSAKEDISQQAASGKSFLKQESCQEITIEPEVDYQADLQEKLDILASESPLKLDAVREEDADQLEIIQESEKETDNVIDDTANRLVADVLAEVLDQPDGRGSQASGNESHQYYTATEQSTKGDDQYDTCVTSQEDNYESAQGWTSQDSEYTTATSGANSRLSEMEERQEQTTPLAMLSPVDSDRQFTVSQDYDSDLPTVRIGIDKRFDIQESSTARSTPDVPIQVTIEEEESEYENLPTSPSGVLLAPQVDPGRPVSPIPPPRPTSENDDDDDESAFTFVAKPSEEELIRTPSGGATSAEESEMHERAMDTYSRQLSDVSSSESRADTVIHRKQQDEQSDVVTDVDELSMAELQEEKSATPSSLLQSGSEGEGTHRSEQIPQISEQTIPVEQSFQTEEVEGFVMYRTPSDQDEGEKQQQESELVEGEQQEELETVEEEPEDSDSLNGHGSRGSGSGHSDLSKYKHHSSDNVSLTSLQEFERLEQVLASRGTVPEPGISSSELELYAKLKAANGAATSLSNGSNEGSISSLAEFEKLEAEIAAQQQATAAAQSEEVMMLSDIKEESEVEDMSVKEDDETEEVSDAEVKTKPISQRATPTAPSEADSLERNVMTTSDIVLLETSTDSLEPSGVILSEERRQSAGGSVDRVGSQQKRSPSAESLEGFEVVSKMQASTNDSLENIAQEKDSLLEGASQEMTSQDTHGMLSADTMETYGEEDKDSLSGDMENMLERYPTTLTTFETTAVTPDGTVQTISRRVETRVRDPIMSHVAFTGTESEDRLRELGEEEQFETVDAEGNVTRTTYRRISPTGRRQ